MRTEQERGDYAEGEWDGESMLEQGEGIPLLKKYEDDKSLGTNDDWQAPAVILGFQCLESLGFYGITANLVIYLGSILHQSNAAIATSVSTWAGTSYFTPFLGALIADSYWGSYRMILLSSLMDLTGMAFLTLSSLIPSLKPQKCTFFFGLYLVAFGSGGIKSSLLPLGADQFKDEKKRATFFNWFYFCLNASALISSTVIVWVQENISWALGYGASTAFMAFAIGLFLLGSKKYRLRKPNCSPMTRAFQVLTASLRKKKCKLPNNSSAFYDPIILGSRSLQHTDEFRFLDKAAIMLDSDVKDDASYSPWRLCPVTQIEELKILLRLLPMWLTGILYSVAYSQMNSTFVEQGKAMDRVVGTFSIPPASLYAFQVLCVMLLVAVYDLVIVEAAKTCLGNDHGLTQLQRMGIGYALMILTMVVSAIVESRRLRSAETGDLISIFWQLPQYFLMAGSEVFNYIGQLEFFYTQAPESMRSLCTAFSLLTVALGNYLNAIVVVAVTEVTTFGGGKGWIPDNLDDGHLNYFFWALAAVSATNFFAFASCARKYSVTKPVLGY